MPHHLVPIMIKVGLREGAQRREADYPPFNQLPPEVRGGMDWAYYIDAAGIGMCYDCCSHDEEG